MSRYRGPDVGALNPYIWALIICCAVVGLFGPLAPVVIVLGVIVGVVLIFAGVWR